MVWSNPYGCLVQSKVEKSWTKGVQSGPQNTNQTRPNLPLLEWLDYSMWWGKLKETTIKLKLEESWLRFFGTLCSLKKSLTVSLSPLYWWKDEAAVGLNRMRVMEKFWNQAHHWLYFSFSIKSIAKHVNNRDAMKVWIIWQWGVCFCSVQW